MKQQERQKRVKELNEYLPSVRDLLKQKRSLWEKVTTYGSINEGLKELSEVIEALRFIEQKRTLLENLLGNFLEGIDLKGKIDDLSERYEKRCAIKSFYEKSIKEQTDEVEIAEVFDSAMLTEIIKPASGGLSLKTEEIQKEYWAEYIFILALLKTNFSSLFSTTTGKDVIVGLAIQNVHNQEKIRKIKKFCDEPKIELEQFFELIG